MNNVKSERHTILKNNQQRETTPPTSQTTQETARKMKTKIPTLQIEHHPILPGFLLDRSKVKKSYRATIFTLTTYAH